MPVTMPLQETREVRVRAGAGATPSAQLLPSLPATLPLAAAIPGQAELTASSVPLPRRWGRGVPRGPLGGDGIWGGHGGLHPLSPLCPPLTHWRAGPTPSHSPCKYRAHRREEPLRGVEAKDGYAVCLLQAELQDQGRQAGSAGTEGGLSVPARPPSRWQGTPLPGCTPWENSPGPLLPLLGPSQGVGPSAQHSRQPSPSGM